MRTSITQPRPLNFNDGSESRSRGRTKVIQFWIDRLKQSAQQYGFGCEGPFKPDRWLGDDDTVSIGNQTLDVIHCPGHTPGHVVFIHKPTRFAIVGDVIFQDRSGARISRRQPPRSDYRSIRNKVVPVRRRCDVSARTWAYVIDVRGAEERRSSSPYVSDAATSSAASVPLPRKSFRKRRRTVIDQQGAEQITQIGD
jgi:hypothetical protein